ncbi:MAG: hypothetical protein KDE34_15110, partial [Anaerolineales bacterium]|nr:hypothetical protein [Anaerolineales bacterium]
MIRFRQLAIAVLLGLMALTLSFSHQRQILATTDGPSGHIPSVSLQQPGEIGFLTAPAAAEPLTIVVDLLQARASDLTLTQADVAAGSFVVSDLYMSEHTGVTHVYLQQTHAGIRVYNAYVNANVMPDGRVVNLISRFVPDLAGAVNTTEAALTPVEAVAVAAAELGLGLPEALNMIAAEADAGSYLFAGTGVSLEDIPVQLIYQPISTTEVRLAWDVEIYELGGENYWSMRFDALTGELLSQYNYVVHDDWGTAAGQLTSEAPAGFAPEGIA